MPPRECDGYYEVSTGYRKVTNDYCTGGVNHDPFVLTCAGLHNMIKTNITRNVLVLVCLLLLIWFALGENGSPKLQ